MKIKIFKDLKQYTLTSALKKEDIDLVKKYRPSALKKQDSDGNDIFAMSYVEGKSCVAPNGITFGAVNSEGFVMIVGELPCTFADGVTAGDFIADKVGSALGYVNELEGRIPSVVTSIKEERKALIEGIESV